MSNSSMTNSQRFGVAFQAQTIVKLVYFIHKLKSNSTFWLHTKVSTIHNLSASCDTGYNF